MGATSACVGMGHTLKNATTNQHPHRGKLTHKDCCVGAGPPGPVLFHVQKVQNPPRLGQSSVGHSGTKRNSVGPQDVSETAPSGQGRDR